MASKKKINILPIIGIAAVAGAGFFVYQYIQKKKNKPTPEPTPEPAPTPTPKKPTRSTQTTSKASLADRNKLQELLISLYSKYSGNKINDVVYTSKEAAGGWGAKSESALSNVVASYALPLSASNAQTYIDAVTKLNVDRAAAVKAQATKQTDLATRKATAADIVKKLDSGSYRAKLLTTVTAPALQYDAVKNTYRGLNSNKTFSAGKVFSKGDLKERGDGTVLIVQGLTRYPINVDNLLTYTN